MNSKVRKELRTIASQDVTNFKNYALDEERKSKGLKVLSDELKILHDEETHRVELTNKRKKMKIEDIKAKAQISLDDRKYQLDERKYEHMTTIENAKLKLETLKMEQQKRVDDVKLELEERKVQSEEDKLQLEVNRFKDEIRAREEDIQRQRVDKIINIAMELLKIGIPLAIYTRLVMMNFRLVYADDGRVPSEMRDLMKNIYKGKM